MWLYLVCHDGPAGGTSICCDDDSAIVQGADNGCSGAGGFGERHALSVESGVSVVVGEVEARHGCCVVVVRGERAFLVGYEVQGNSVGMSRSLMVEDQESSVVDGSSCECRYECEAD